MVTETSEISVGVLALQGAFGLHVQMLEEIARNKQIDISIVELRTPNDLIHIDGVILPGGESTVQKKLLESSGLGEPLTSMMEQGLPVLATCAGLILLCDYFETLDCSVDRNAYGRQRESFESLVTYEKDNQKYSVSFIRAPKITRVGPGVESVVTHMLDRGTEEEIVGVATQSILGLSCHPEVTRTTVFHEFFVAQILQRVTSKS